MFNDFNFTNYKETVKPTEKEVKMEHKDCNCGCGMEGIVCPVIYECPVERCIHRNIVHKVPHIVPVNTKIINHHIYEHSYDTCYTCSEENTFTNVNENRCPRF